MLEETMYRLEGITKDDPKVSVYIQVFTDTSLALA